MSFLDVQSAAYVPQLYGGMDREALADQMRGWLGEGFLLGEWQTLEMLSEILGRRWFDRGRSVPGLGSILRWLVRSGAGGKTGAMGSPRVEAAAIESGETEIPGAGSAGADVSRVVLNPEHLVPPATVHLNRAVQSLGLRSAQLLIAQPLGTPTSPASIRLPGAPAGASPQPLSPSLIRSPVAPRSVAESVPRAGAEEMGQGTAQGTARGTARGTVRNATPPELTLAADADLGLDLGAERAAFDRGEGLEEEQEWDDAPEQAGDQSPEADFADLEALLASPALDLPDLPDSSDSSDSSDALPVAAVDDGSGDPVGAPRSLAKTSLGQILFPNAPITPNPPAADTVTNTALPNSPPEGLPWVGPVDETISQALIQAQSRSTPGATGLRLPLGNVSTLYRDPDFTATVLRRSLDPRDPPHLTASVQTPAPPRAPSAVSASAQPDRLLPLTQSHWHTLAQGMAQVIADRRSLEALQQESQGQVRQLRDLLRDLSEIFAQETANPQVRRLRSTLGTPDTPMPETGTAPAPGASPPGASDQGKRTESWAQLPRLQTLMADLDRTQHQAIAPLLQRLHSTTQHLQADLAVIPPRVSWVKAMPWAWFAQTLADDLGKVVTVSTDGAGVLLDPAQIQRWQPIVSALIRVAVCQSLEVPIDRERAGKPRSGSLHLQALNAGNQTLLLIEDDGHGIPGLASAAPPPQPPIPPDDPIADVSAFPFRQLVRTAQQLGGNLTHHSTPGQGNGFTLFLPLSPQPIAVHCCRTQFLTVAIPQDIVVATLTPAQRGVGSMDQLSWQEQPLPYYPLQRLLALHSPLHVAPRQQSIGPGAILVIQIGALTYALGVDHLGESVTCVTQPLLAPRRAVSGIAGVAVLADGRIVPVVDGWSLGQLAQGLALPGTIEALEIPAVPASPEALASPLGDERDALGLGSVPGPVPDSPPRFNGPPPRLTMHSRILVVDDSRTVRQCLLQTLADLPYAVEEAEDGQAAWDKLQAGLDCALMIVDLEVPRMTGFELLEHLQRDPQLASIPVLMLTSRGGDRHREIARQLGAQAYFTKPYSELSLLQAVQALLGP